MKRFLSILILTFLLSPLAFAQLPGPQPGGGGSSGGGITADGSTTLTNKTINADNNTITNIDNNEIKAAAAIDAAKIADGTISSTEFQYLNGVTSAIQTQLTTAKVKHLQFVLVGPTTDITVDDVVGDFEFELPFAGTITGVGCYSKTAGTTGSQTVDVNIDGSTILSTLITIETTEKSSRDATTQPVISGSAVVVGDLLTFDSTVIQTTPAKGLTCWLNVQL